MSAVDLANALNEHVKRVDKYCQKGSREKSIRVITQLKDILSNARESPSLICIMNFEQLEAKVDNLEFMILEE